MTELGGNYTPGLAASDSDTYTEPDLILAGGPGPHYTSYGSTFDDLAKYSLVGRVTATGVIVLSNPGASDGSQIPIGVTTHATTVNFDSNSAVDSNSSFSEDAERVGYWTDGQFNYDTLAKHGSWTMDQLNRVLEANGRNFRVDVPKTATPTEPTGS